MSDAPNRTVELWALLTARLIAATEAKKVEWKPGASSDPTGTVRTRFDGLVLKIFEDEPDIVVSIFLETGALVDQFRDVDIQEEMLGSSYRLLFDLHRTATRQVNGADSAVEKILNLLPETDKYLRERKKTDFDDDIPF